MIRMGVVSNLQSRRNKRGLGRIESMLARRRDVIHIPIESNSSASEILAELARREVTVVAVNGGDGTVQRMLTALLASSPFETQPILAALPGGTTNLIARDLGFRSGLRHSLIRLLDMADNGQIDSVVGWRHVMRVRNLNGHPPQGCMFFCTAILAKAIARYQDWRGHRKRDALADLASSLARTAGACAGIQSASTMAAADRIHVLLDERDYGDRHRFLMFVTTLERLIFGLKPYWNWHGEPLRFTSVAYPPRRLLRSVLHISLGRNGADLPQETYESGGANRITMRLPGPVALDGELFVPTPAQPIVITSGPLMPFVQA